MADTRLRALIESIFDSKGTDSAQVGMKGVTRTTDEMSVAQAAAARQSEMLSKKMRELSSDVAAGNKSIEQATKEFEQYKTTLTPLPGVMDKTSAATEKTGGAFGSLNGMLTKLAAGGLLIQIGQAALEFGKASIQAASDAGEMQAKFDVVFGSSAPQAQAALEDLAGQVNRSATELQGMSASIQDTFVPMGFARDEAAKLSVELTKLAVDVGSFNNVADADVMRDFQSALVGNTETVRKYGIVITEANTKQKAYAMGIAEVGSELTEQQKVQARLQLIMEGTTDAQGDAIRTADSYANVQKGLQAATSDLQIALGKLATEGLAPAGKEATTLVQNLTDLVGWIGKVEDVTAQHNAEIARSTASYEDYAAEVVRVAVETGKLNEKQGQIVLATMLTADANTELSGTMQKVTEEIGLMTNEERIQLQQTESLTAAYEAAGVSAYVWSDAQATFTATSTYATEAMARQNDTITTQTGALYALQTAIKGVGSDLDFAAQAASLLNDVLVVQGDTVSENNQRLLDFMLATGELTEAEYEDAVAKNKQINLLEILNGALAANMITMEQWTEIVRDGKITTEELTGAVTALWGAFLDNSLDVTAEDAAAMEDAIGDAYETMGSGEMFGPFAEKALAAGMALSTLAGGAGGLQPVMSTLDETIVTANDDLEAMRDVMGDLEGMHQVGINVTVTGDPIPSIGGTGTVDQGKPGTATELDTGGIIPGAFSQPVPIIAHGSEMVLNPTQQSNLFALLNGGSNGGGGGVAPVNVYVMLDGQQLAAAIEIRSGQRARQASGAFRP